MSELIVANGTVMNRREFINLAWLISMGFLVVNLGGVTYLFSLPRFRAGEFGGQFVLGNAREVFPPPGEAPVIFPKGKFWLVRTSDNLVVAIYNVCTHLGCLYNWDNQTVRYRCPCHGSEFQLDGTYISGPAPRSLDRFVMHLVDAQGNEVASTDADGNPLPLPDDDLQVVVETGLLIRGKPRGASYLESNSQVSEEI
ncbi:MAG: Rieske (2Fe-2S) protein [Anaerolineales bacterium]|nr:Rieske (2Fe-2S) protein [Anaerolineales bacterium]